VNVRRVLVIAGLELQTLVKGPLFWVLVLATWLATLSINPAALMPSCLDA